MAPAPMQTVTVTGTLYDPDGSLAIGSVTLTPAVQTLHPDSGAVVVPATLYATLVGGAFSKAVTVGGNPALATWHVAERCTGGASYDIIIDPANGPVQDLSALAPVASSSGTPVVVGPRGPSGGSLVESPPGSGLYLIGA